MAKKIHDKNSAFDVLETDKIENKILNKGTISKSEDIQQVLCKTKTPMLYEEWEKKFLLLFAEKYPGTSFPSKNLLITYYDEYVVAVKGESNIKESSINKSQLDSAFELIEKGGPLNTAKLIKKKVQIHANGKTYTGYRWVSADTGMPAHTDRESKDNKQHKEKIQAKAKEAPIHVTKDETDPHEGEVSERVNQIISSNGKWNNKVRDLIGLGIYDASLVLQLVPEVESVGKFAAYAKEAGINLKKLESNLEDNINISLGNSSLKDAAISELQNSLKQKDFLAIKKQRKEELAKQYGITSDDKFNAYEFKLEQLIVDRQARSLIAYGTGGIGKTFTLEQKLEEAGKIGWDPELDLEADEYDYVKVTGNTSPTDLYELMYENPRKLIIFDDCDSMWDDENMANMLKGALDTTGDRLIRYANPKKLPDGTYPPKAFKFNGQIIFISNLKREDFYAPLVDSRSNAIDLTMNMEQTLQKIESIKYKFKYKDVDGNELEISKHDRDDIVKVLNELKNDLRIEQVNGRVLGNLAALKAGLTKRGKTSYEEFKKQAMLSLDLV